MAAKLLKKRFNIQNVNDWLAENDKNMDGKLKIIFILSLFSMNNKSMDQEDKKNLCLYMNCMVSPQNE